MSRIRLAIFDWAGTIIDHGVMAPVTAFKRVFQLAGVPVTTEEVRQPMGLHKKTHIQKMLEIPSVNKRFQRRHKRPFTSSDVNRIYESFKDVQKEALLSSSKVITGVPPMLYGLRQAGIRVGSTTGYNRSMVGILHPVLLEQGVKLDTIVTSDDVPEGRPAPDMIRRNMELLGIYNPAQCVKIGDTGVDIAEGRNAGVWTVGVVESSNYTGLTEVRLASLQPAERSHILQRTYDRLSAEKPHVIVRRTADVPWVLDMINYWLARGLKP